MLKLKNRVPPVMVACLCGAAMWGIAACVPSLAATRSCRLAGAAVAGLLGIGFGVAGVVSFRQASTTVNPMKPETTSVLVRSGIYRVSRNPMYVGIALLLVAWAIYLSSPAAMAGVIGFKLYMDRFQIEPEERALMQLFGETFAQYKSTVRRWL